MLTATVSSKGWVVIPKELRKKHGLTPGRKVTFVDHAETMTIVPVEDDPVAAIAAMFADHEGPSWSEVLIEEHRLERERDEERLARHLRPR